MRKTLVLEAIILVSVVLVSFIFVGKVELADEASSKQFYLGVSYCGNSVNEAEQLVDKVKNYTNLFILQSGELQEDQNSIIEIGNYAISSGLSYIVYCDDFSAPELQSFVTEMHHKWGNHFLGLYFGDELGGKMLDGTPMTITDPQTNDTITKNGRTVTVTQPDSTTITYQADGIINVEEKTGTQQNSDCNSTLTPQGNAIYITYNIDGSAQLIESNGTIININNSSNSSLIEPYQEIKNQFPFNNYDAAANFFSTYVTDTLKNADAAKTAIFTSDYALYWYDYLSGYDVVLAQLGWNNSVNQQIALVRGAANLNGKNWGVTITWTYDNPPYICGANQMYNEMLQAYQAGATYITVFNYPATPGNYTGVLDQAHFDAIESFWNQVKSHPRSSSNIASAQAVLVLPQNYGWGMRSPGDNIWGLWSADQESQQIWNITSVLLGHFGDRLDIVYGNAKFPIEKKYQKIYYWNETITNLNS